MDTVSDLLDRAGSRIEIAAECDVEPIAVYRWSRANSIPSKHLPGVLRVSARNKSGVTAEALCIAHDVSPTAPSSEGSALKGSLPDDKRLGGSAEVQGANS